MPTYQSVFPLHDGDTIGFFSPSEWLGDNRPQRVRSGAEFIQNQGFNTYFAHNMLARDIIRAGTVSQRLADINELLDAQYIRALLATWGGKSCNQLINCLPYDKFGTNQKPIIGFSDICVLLNQITAKTGLVTFYGPNIAGKLNESTWSNLQFLRSNFSWEDTNILGGAKDVGTITLRNGSAKGRLFGGNLNCFVLGVSMSSTDLSFFDNGIFFWEDIGLTPRQIDQFLTSLANIGFLSRISGMIIGDFFSSEKNEWLHSDPLESVMNVIKDFNFPAIYAPTFGHKKLENPVFPIGAQSILNTTDVYLHCLDTILSI